MHKNNQNSQDLGEDLIQAGRASAQGLVTGFQSKLPETTLIHFGEEMVKLALPRARSIRL